MKGTFSFIVVSVSCFPLSSCDNVNRRRPTGSPWASLDFSFGAAWFYKRRTILDCRAREEISRAYCSTTPRYSRWNSRSGHPVNLSKVKVGDKVRFTLRGSGNLYAVQSISPAPWLRHWDSKHHVSPMSTLHPKAGMCVATRDDRFGPKADIDWDRTCGGWFSLSGRTGSQRRRLRPSRIFIDFHKQFHLSKLRD